LGLEIICTLHPLAIVQSSSIFLRETNKTLVLFFSVVSILVFFVRCGNRALELLGQKKIYWICSHWSKFKV